MNKFSKKQLIDAIKNMKTKETNIIRQNGEIEIMAKGDEIEPLLSKDITLKSIYNLMTTKFKSIENEIKSVKVDVSSLKVDVSSVKVDVSSVKVDVKKLDTKLNKVIELNNLKV